MSARTILFVSAALDNGGSERHATILLPGLRTRGFAVDALTLSGEGRAFHELRSKGIDIHCAGMRRRTDVPGLRRAVALVGDRPDVIVSQSLSAQVFAELVAERVGAPHLTIEHTSPGFPLRVHQRALLGLFAPRVGSVVAVARAQLPRLIRLGYRRERIRVIPNGIPELVPALGRSATRTRLGLQDDEFVALLVANLRSFKRPDLFLESVVAAHRSDPKIRGLIVGDGPERARMTELADRSEGVVRLLGSRADVPDLLAAADVLCLTSLTESMPITILEAMSLGRAVIATNVGGIPELVDEETGILLPPEHCGPRLQMALLHLAADPQRTRQLGCAGRKRYEDSFTADRMVDRYALALRELCDRAGARKIVACAAGPSPARSQMT